MTNIRTDLDSTRQQLEAAIQVSSTTSDADTVKDNVTVLHSSRD